MFTNFESNKCSNTDHNGVANGKNDDIYLVHTVPSNNNFNNSENIIKITNNSISTIELLAIIIPMETTLVSIKITKSIVSTNRNNNIKRYSVNFKQNKKFKK